MVVERATAGDPGKLFYNAEYNIVARAIHKLVEAGSEHLHESAIRDQLSVLGADNWINDPDQLLRSMMMYADINRVAALEASVNILVDRWEQREILTGLEQLRHDIMTSTAGGVNDIAAKIRAMGINHAGMAELISMKDLIEDIEALEDPAWTLTTGLTELDRLLRGGWEPGRIYALAARPKIGKTTLMFSAVDAALSAGAVVLVVSLETLHMEFYAKMMATRSGIDQTLVKDVLQRRIQLKDLPRDVRKDFEEVRQELKELPLHPMFMDSVPNGADSVVSMAMRLRNLYGDRRQIVVFIDYLQLMVKDHFNKQAEVSSYTRELKKAAAELNLPIVFLSQLNREGSDGTMPQPHHMRDSGSLEQDSDVVIMMNRLGETDPSAPKHVMDLWVALSRVGPAGTIHVNWNGSANLVFDLEEAHVDVVKGPASSKSSADDAFADD